MNHIPPYPGLRPFNEDESIFFKGRDEHIASITHQLEQKKFVMITGASGDGKSSLVYAGVVPNARAGFFKAKFNNWLLVDFRPERSPLKNLAVSLNDRLKLGSAAETEKGLSYGFSSLVDVYKKSAYYLDTSGEAYINADEKEKRKLKSRAGNLFILLDQFEEFFTNKENYTDGRTSQESRAVMNLLLETMKIAVDEDLPIYIVCTMRSDYIGQCAAFRGLPEAIGYSQFFVPRLKRQELQQVIEEPAKLNGDSISRRLTEVLLNASSEGIDQLPVLQHALNLMWKEAKEGQEEIDVLHFAKVAGFDANKLTKEDKQAFDNWFSAIPESKKEWFKHPSLDNVLDFHANTLYETPTQPPPQGEGLNTRSADELFVIETAFKCLTKVDNGRAVRNRMTLGEITNVINRPEITAEVLDNLLRPFRLQGNTFLKPFVEDDGRNENLSETAVLDITHESLIRNWGKLSDWANEEENNHQTFQDFEKQLNRWVAHDKSHDYLLPIGPLTYFEGFYNAQKPNKYWLTKFDESETTATEKLVSAEKTIANSEEFIKLSSRKLFFSRTVLKYGFNKIAAAIGSVFLIIACLYYYNDYLYKQNDAVVERILLEGQELLSNSFVKNGEKAEFAINWEQIHGKNSYHALLDSLHNDTLEFDIAFEMYRRTNNNGESKELKLNSISRDLIDFMETKLYAWMESAEFKQLSEGKYQRLSTFIRSCVQLHLLSHDETLKAKYKKGTNYFADNYIFPTLKDSTVENRNPLLFYEGFIHILNNLNEDTTRLKSLFISLNLYDNEEASSRFYRLFTPSAKIKADYNYNFSHNGGYYLLSVLAALNHAPNLAVKCLDSVYAKQTFLADKNNYLSFYLLRKMNIVEMNIVMEGISKHTQASKKVLWGKLISMHTNTSIGSRGLNSHDEVNENYISALHSEKTLAFANNYYIENILGSIANSDERNFQTALHYKNLAMVYQLNGANQKSKRSVDLAFDYFKDVSDAYLNQEITVKAPGDGEQFTINRKTLFVYPKNISSNFESKWDVYDFSKGSVPNEFVNHLFSRAIFQETIFSEKDYAAINEFLKKQEINTDSLGQDGYFNVETFRFVKSLIDENLIGADYFDLDYINGAICFNDLLRTHKSAFTITNAFVKHLKDNHPELLKALGKLLAQNGKINESLLCLRAINPVYKKNAIADIVYEMNTTGRNAEYMPVFMDEMLREIDSKPQFANFFFTSLSSTGSSRFIKLGFDLLKEKADKDKPTAINYFVRGLAEVGLLHKAYRYIPNEVSSNSKLINLNIILSFRESETIDKEWANYKYVQKYRYGSGKYETIEPLIFVWDGD